MNIQSIVSVAAFTAFGFITYKALVGRKPDSVVDRLRMGKRSGRLDPQQVEAIIKRPETATFSADRRRVSYQDRQYILLPGDKEKLAKVLTQ